MIHTVIPDDQLPDCLKRKPVFGDREQIEALRHLENIVNENEKKSNGQLKKYSVTLSWSGEIDVEVWAEDKNDAEEIARNENDYPDSCDLDFDGAWAREIIQKAEVVN